MIRESHEKLRPILERRDHGFRWRGKEVSRIEGLSDAVFAFAVTLLVVSLEAPKRFDDLMKLMHGFVSFAICFLLLLLIWHAQYLYFRRYALDDRASFLLNSALLFVVAFYVYPLKFLTTLLTNAITGYRELDDAGNVIKAMQYADWKPLMMIYSAGFVALYLIFALMYLHAYRLRDALELNALETHETRGVILENVIMIGIGTVSFVLAWLDKPQFSGMIYFLIGPLQGWLGSRHGKGRKRLALVGGQEDRMTG